VAFFRIYKTITLHLVLYECEIRPLALREKHSLRVFENRVLRRTFGPRRYEVTGGSRKLHNEELHNLYSSRNINRITKARKMTWAGNVARMGIRKRIWDIGGKAGRRETTSKTKA
jgi:hypothetical protein